MRTRTVGATHLRKKLAQGSARAAVLVMPIVLGILDTPATKTQALTDGQAAETLKFEVASIRPCKNSDTTPSRKGGRGGVRSIPDKQENNRDEFLAVVGLTPQMAGRYQGRIRS